MKHIPCALTIAGSDPSGGAGIQADLKTFQELQSYGMSVITSLTAQNTTGVQGVYHIPTDMIEQQLTSIMNDMPIHAFKTGMIANVDMMKVIEKRVPEINAPYIMDPVMVATSGDPLISTQAQQYLCNHLLPLATVVTPNIPEAETIIGEKINTEDDMKEAAIQIVKHYGAQAALIKGGHIKGDAVDFLYDGNNMFTFSAQRIETKNSHGTGCTLSAAITAFLAQGASFYDAVKRSKTYITLAIKHSLPLGNGSGPTNHWAPRINETTKLEEIKS
ncbi:bifunctional hydroxymethylpyrimidine kinase/phosphomethylpyrimidine kinase [Virgibacillus soli]|uniref:Hydroxymethylpyrimidine/phosphomethylpyrimidine kinase n=1 Tax=Paracerasibacillus soli TaxID=480284 RepID=A0ABU5CV58_9BACI|nr:bifunctional hydroxymethylpyrimidine kinase/phosphomethylpyrimidine kinase [Virgibacillus soli]MDY0410267.1 bifunctional hydroxymethylpyrimidine kinase/phosphomethylpyrimidine kinase [Virgibacillus soli]